MSTAKLTLALPTGRLLDTSAALRAKLALAPAARLADPGHVAGVWRVPRPPFTLSPCWPQAFPIKSHIAISTPLLAVMTVEPP